MTRKISCVTLCMKICLALYKLAHLYLSAFSSFIGETTVETGGKRSPNFRLGTNDVLVPNILAVVFKKQEISQQVVTRMHDLASEFS